LYFHDLKEFSRKQNDMTTTEFNKQPIVLLRTSFNILFRSPAILFPFSIIAFIQLLIFEIFFFAPRFPLNLFFDPIIKRFEGARYLIYPNNYILLNKWFNHWSIQAFIFIFFGSFFIGVAINIINNINSDKQIGLKRAYKEISQRYVHLWCAALIHFGLIYFLTWVYGLFYQRAAMIRSTTGFLYFIKQFVIEGAPFYQLLIALFSLGVFAYIFPIIVLEKKSIFKAFVLNFKKSWPSFICIFLIIVLPGMLYIPFILLKMNWKLFFNIWTPEGWGIFMVCFIFLAMFVDAWQYTAITTCYILDKEEE